MTVGEGGSEVLRREIEDLPDRFAFVEPVPLTFKLRNSVLGIAGDLDRSLVRSVVGLAATLHTPAELSVALIASKKTESDWEWMQWLPHVHDSGLVNSPLATEYDSVASLLAELERVALRPVEAHDRDLLLVVDDSVPADRSRLISTLRLLKGSRVSVLWVADSLEDLPRECDGVALRSGDGGSFSYVAEGRTVEPAHFDQLGVADLSEIARELAGTVDLSYAESADATPELVTLGDLLGGEDPLDDPALILSRWEESASNLRRGGTSEARAGLLAAVGIGEAVVSLDLRHDGPHALVAGTTGSGKSEFLQTWVTMMAASHSPQHLTFLFVDYKGGAAFQACTELPHAVGLVTDLDTNQVRRALVSLRSELHRRERLLKDAGEKDLASMEKVGHPDTPPSLVIVVDEFAALANEVPEFVEGVVDIAARGRSLGLHLILATERPAGVITDNIRANTNLRVALRMADESESSDVVGVKDAAHFTQSGRAIVRSGPGRSRLLQTGFAGAVTSATEDEGLLQIADLRFNQIQFAGRTAAPSVADAPKDIERLVASINSAFARLGAEAPAIPWREPLWSPLPLEPDLVDASSPEQVFVGLRDEPENRAYSWVYLEPEREGSWLVLGTGGSGKTTFMRTVAVSLAVGREPDRVAVYGLDFGGRGLGALEELPIVGSIVEGSDVERVAGLFSFLEREVDERSASFAKSGIGSYGESLSTLADAPKRIFVLIDGIQAFVDEYSRIERGRWPAALQRLIATGRSVGVHFILSGDRRGGIPLALLSNIQRTIVFRMASRDDYGLLSVPKDVLTADSPAGRCLDLDHEVQIAVAGGSTDGTAQIEQIRAHGERLRSDGVLDVAPIGALPPIVPAAALPGSDQIEIGIGGVELHTLSIPPTTSGFCIFGEAGSGKTSTLIHVLSEYRRLTPDRTLFLAGPKPFETRPLRVDRSGFGPEEAAAVLEAALEDLNEGRNPVVAVDDVVDLLETDAGAHLQRLVESLRLHPGTVLVTANSWLAGSSFHKALKELRASGWGLILQPDLQRDGVLFNSRLPQTMPGASIPGRGLIVRKGTVSIVQVASRTAEED